MIVRRQHPRAIRYGFAVLLVSLLTWFTKATWPLFHVAPLLPIAAGVVVAATLAGPGPGFLATALGLVASVLIPHAPARPSENMAVLIVFAGLGVAVSALSLSRHLSRGRIRRILEGVSDGCAVLGADWKYRFVNRAAADLAGRPPEALVGSEISDVFPHIADLPALREVRRAMDEGIPARLESWYAPHERWYETNLYPTGEGLVIIARDATDRRGAEEALRESERRLRAIFDQSIAGIAQTDPEGRFLLVNERFCEIAGRSAGELASLRMCDIVHPEDFSRNASLFAGLMGAGADFVTEQRYVRPSGAVVWVRKQVSAVRDPNGTPRYGFAIVEEITDRKRAESEKDDALARERAAREEAESANQSKDEFLAVVSHELRTPLTAMLGWLRLMRLGVVEASASSRGLETVERNADILARLVSDLLDVSRIASGKLELEARPVSIAGIVGAALDVVRPAVEAKRIRVVFRPVPDRATVLGDAARLQQVVWNLLSNAAKFTAPGGRIDVDVERRGEQWAVSVADDGAGIAPELLPYVFERFRQADGTQNRKHSGLGLGLAIVRHVVEMHGGTVQAESAGERRGSRFTVLLPAHGFDPNRAGTAARDGHPAPEPERAPSSTRGEPLPAREAPPVRTPASPDTFPSLRGTRVLLVEDQEDTRALVGRVLAWRGAEVRSCANVAEARAALAERRYDVLVSDIAMPEESGYALIESVRAAERSRGGRIPAIALTAYAQEAHRRRALAAGYDAHVAKPVEPGELVRAVASVCGGVARV
ncbi:MAG: PAS domain S-box protein [Bacteroidota bacterium]